MDEIIRTFNKRNFCDLWMSFWRTHTLIRQTLDWYELLHYKYMTYRWYKIKNVAANRAGNNTLTSFSTISNKLPPNYLEILSYSQNIHKTYLHTQTLVLEQLPENRYVHSTLPSIQKHNFKRTIPSTPSPSSTSTTHPANTNDGTPS